MYYSWYVVFYRRRLRGSSTFFSSAASVVYAATSFGAACSASFVRRASSVVPRLETPLVAVAVWCENYNYYGLRATTVEVSDAC